MCPLFFSSPDWDSVVYWALDLETGGLDARRDAILSIGMVPVRARTVRLGEAFRTLVHPVDGDSIDPRSVEAHQLVWEELRAAPSLAEVLPEVDLRLREGVLLVHNRNIDEAFLKRAFKRLGREWPRPPVVDTVDLLFKLHRRRSFVDPHLPETMPVINLGKVRRLNGLPAYEAHDPLNDAVATAELFLVLQAKLGARTLRDLR